MRRNTVDADTNIHDLQYLFNSWTNSTVPLSYQRLVDEVRVQYCTGPFQSVDSNYLSRVDKPDTKKVNVTPDLKKKKKKPNKQNKTR